MTGALRVNYGNKYGKDIPEKYNNDRLQLLNLKKMRKTEYVWKAFFWCLRTANVKTTHAPAYLCCLHSEKYTTRI